MNNERLNEENDYVAQGISGGVSEFPVCETILHKYDTVIEKKCFDSGS